MFRQLCWSATKRRFSLAHPVSDAIVSNSVETARVQRSIGNIPNPLFDLVAAYAERQGSIDVDQTGQNLREDYWLSLVHSFVASCKRPPNLESLRVVQRRRFSSFMHCLNSGVPFTCPILWHVSASATKRGSSLLHPVTNATPSSSVAAASVERSNGSIAEPLLKPSDERLAAKRGCA